MSGIAGIIDFSGAPIPPGLIEAMTSEMSHRGPDGITHWVGGNAAFGHCMLHTTLESLTERQPLNDVDSGYVLIADGRVDNWEELRASLQLPRANDAELMLAAYKRWDVDFPSRLEGDFAVAIWDCKKQSLFCARDIHGIKPFYYHFDGRFFSFASELASLLDLPWVESNLDVGMVAEWLGYAWTSREDTFWTGIKRLLPAHVLSATPNSDKKIHEYWRPILDAPLEYQSDEEAIEHYRALIKDVVRRTCRSHKPVAFEVSGGLDSSAVFSVADSLSKQDQFPAPSMQGYTMDTRGTPADEMTFVDSVSSFLGRAIVPCPIFLPDLAWYRDRTRRFRDFAGFPSSVLGQNMHRTAHAAGTVVVVGGQGGDEWLGAWNPDTRYTDLIHSGNLSSAWALFVSEPTTAWSILRHTILPELLGRPPYYRAKRAAWLVKPLQQKLARRAKPVSFNQSHLRPSHRMRLNMLKDPFYGHANDLGDKLYAHLGMENRSPMLNKQIVQFAFSTPENLRFRAGTEKWLHRQAMQSYLPLSLIHRADKSPFISTFDLAIQEASTRLKCVAKNRSEWIDQIIAQPTPIGRILYGDASGADYWQCWSLLMCDLLAELNARKG